MEWLVLGLLFILTLTGTTQASISDLRRCGDPLCKEPVSEGLTLLRYPSNDPNILSFSNNVPVTIYSKDAGTKPDLWGVEIKGKRGYVPKKYIRETKLFKPKLEHVVPTEGLAAKDVKTPQKDLPNEKPLENAGENDQEISKNEDQKENVNADQIAITAEDVEYNNVNTPGTREERHPDKEEEEEAVRVDSETSTESIWAEDPVGNEDTTKENLIAGEEEAQGEEEEEEEEEEEVNNDGDIFIDEGKEEEKEEETAGKSDNIFDSLKEPDSTTEEVPVATESSVFPPATPDSEIKSENSEENGEDSDMQSESSEENVHSELPNAQTSPQLESSSAEPDSPQLEASAADYEVVDGTTIYFNEDLPTPTLTLPEVKPTVPASIGQAENIVIPQASVVQGENLATVDPSIKSSMETRQSGDSGKPMEGLQGKNRLDPQSNTQFDPHSSTPALDDTVKSSVTESAKTSPPEDSKHSNEHLENNVPSAPNLRNLVLPPDNLRETSHELNDEGSDELVTDSLNVAAPPSTDAGLEDIDEATETTSESAEITTETNPEISKDPAAESTTESSIATDSHTTNPPEEEFGIPKPETVLEDGGAEVEEPAESVGFFASWFGSSESTDTKDESDLEADDNDEDEEEEVEADKVVNTDVETPSASKDSTVGAEDSAIETNADEVASDDPDTLVDTDTTSSYNQATHTHSAEDLGTPAYSAEDVDSSAFTSQQATPPSVDGSPAESTTPGNSEVESESPPSPSAADLTPDLPEPGTDSQEETVYSGGPETEPRPSTARPLYAEPLPTIPSHHPEHSSVDPADVERLADVADDSTTQTKDDEEKISSAEGSFAEKFLKTSHNLLETVAAALQLPEGLAFGVEAEFAEPGMSAGMLVFLGVVATTIITIYVVYMCTLKFSRERPMLEKLHRIDRENRIVSAENTSLHEQLVRTRSELISVSSRVQESSGDITELDSQLEQIKDEHTTEKAQLEEKIVQLEHELEEATTNGMEMHKMLSEMLSSQKDTSTFQASVDHLQNMLDGQREKVETLNSDLALKSRLNEELHSELSTAKERVSNLESQVQQLTHSLKELSSAKEDLNTRLENESKLVKELQTANNSLSTQNTDSDSQLASLSAELKALQDTIAQLRDSVETKDSELQVTKECLKQLRLTSDDDHATPDEEKLSSLFDVIRVKAELQKIQSERNRLKEELQDSETAQRNLEDTMTSIRSEVTQLRSHHDQAVQDKQDAMSKLAILTKYFEEKEAQLTKELESQEGLRVDAEGAVAAGASKLQNYGLELKTYKAQVDSLRKELQDQESSFKTQLASYEQKAHENWLQARAAERRHEEQRQENSQLRTRLTMLQKEHDDAHHLPSTKPFPKRVDANGSLSSPGPEGEGSDNHLDSPPVVPHPLAPPPMLPMMFPPGGPLPPVPPPHSLPPGVPPGLPPHGLPPPPFLSGEAPFMGPPLPPLPGDRRLPPAGGMSSPPFRRSGSPSYDHRNNRYSPGSEHSHYSDHQYSPPPPRHRPGSPDLHRRGHSPDRRSDRTRSPDRRSDRMRSPDRRSNRHTPDRRLDRRPSSPERHYSTRSPDGYARHRSSPHRYYDHSDFNSDDARIHSSHLKGKKTSTPLSSSDRWKTDS